MAGPATLLRHHASVSSPAAGCSLRPQSVCNAVAGPSGRQPSLHYSSPLQQQRHRALSQLGFQDPHLGARPSRASVLTAALTLPKGAVFDEDRGFGAQRMLSDSWGFGARVRQAVSYAVFYGLRLTQLAVRLASNLARTVVHDVGHALHLREQAALEQQRAEHEAEAKAAERRAAILALQARAKQTTAADSSLVSMLFSMDNPDRNLDDKWAEMQRHTGCSLEYSRKVDQLFKAAQQSAAAVRQAMAQHTASESTVMWQVLNQHNVVAEEEALRSLVFSQMLSSSA